jgi:molecular chaperone DnaK
MKARDNEIPTVGIDLGTTCSAISVVRDGTPVILPIDGRLLLPSVVALPEGGPALVGQAAVNREVLDPERTIRSAKRLMGSDHRWNLGDQSVQPHEVGARVLERLCDAATAALGGRPRRAVITVPAWFTQAQRAATRSEGELAGLEVARIINEPTAAALAHAHGRDLRRRALVYDFGGGTFDCSLVEQSGVLVEVKASHGDTHLGGDDIDAALVGHVLQRIGDGDPTLRAAIEASAPARVKLRAAVEAAKIELSEVTRTRLQIPFLVEVGDEARHLELELTRGELEPLAGPFVERTLASVEHVLKDSKFEPGDIDELLLVGGSSRIPLVWERLRQRFGLEGSAAIPPDQAVALGAAIQAAIIDGREVTGVLVDVAPYSLSVSAATGPTHGFPTHLIAQVITPRNTPLPSRHTEQFRTLHGQQREARFWIFQGSDINPLRNAVLGQLSLAGLPEAPAGTEGRPISVEFRHNLDGLVEVTVVDDLSGKRSTGRLAADADEVAELREKLREELERDGLIPGDGSDPDPFGDDEMDEDEDDEARDETNGDDAAIEATESGVPLDLGACRATFTAVLGAGERLRKEVPAHAEALTALARDGQAALAQQSLAQAAALWDRLSDRMFELGVYL